MTKRIKLDFVYQNVRGIKILPGVYAIDDPQLKGQGQYLLDTEQARLVDRAVKMINEPDTELAEAEAILTEALASNGAEDAPEDAADELDTLRAEYLAVAYEAPDMRWREDRLREEIKRLRAEFEALDNS